MLYCGSYRITSFFLSLACFHILLGNEQALAREDDLERCAEVPQPALHGKEQNRMEINRERGEKANKPPKGDWDNKNKLIIQKAESMFLGSFVIFCFHVAGEGCLGPAPSCPHPNPTSPAAANWHPRHHLWIEWLVEFAEWSDLLLTPRKCPAGQAGSRLGRALLSCSLSSQSTVAFVRISARGGFHLPVAEAWGRVQAGPRLYSQPVFGIFL